MIPLHLFSYFYFSIKWCAYDCYRLCVTDGCVFRFGFHGHGKTFVCVSNSDEQSIYNQIR